MSWLVEWDEVADSAWKNLPSQDQQLLSNAARRFVETMDGNWELLRDHPDAYGGLLHVENYTLYLVFERRVTVAHVMWFYRGDR